MVAEATGMCVVPFSSQLSYANSGAVVGQGSTLESIESSDKTQELQDYITAVETGSAETQVLQKLALFCLESPVMEPPSPPPSPGLDIPTSPSPFLSGSRSLPSLNGNLWDVNKSFDRLFNALIQFLDPTKVRTPLEKLGTSS